MFVFAAIYIALGFGALAALATMILRIGTLLGECPKSKRIARAASVTIALCLGLGFTQAVGTLRALMQDAQQKAAAPAAA